MKTNKVFLSLIIISLIFIFSACLDLFGTSKKSRNTNLLGQNGSCLSNQISYEGQCYADPNCDVNSDEVAEFDSESNSFICVNNDDDDEEDDDNNNPTLSIPHFRSGKGIADLAVIQGTTVNLNAGFALLAPNGVYKYEFKIITSSNVQQLCQVISTANSMSCGSNVGSPVKVSWRGMNQAGTESSGWSAQYTITAPPATSLNTPALVSGKTVNDLVTYVAMVQRLVINPGNNLTQPTGVVKYSFKFYDSANPAQVRTCSDTVANIVANGIPWGSNNSCGILEIDALPISVQWQGCNSAGTICSSWSVPLIVYSEYE